MIEKILILVVIFIIAKISELSRKVKDLEEKIESISLINNTYQKIEKIDNFLSEDFQKNNKDSMGVQNEYDEKSYLEKTTHTISDSRVHTHTNWFGEDWLLKIGAVLLLLSFSWFVRYAFINDWISELHRIYLGVGAGALLMIYGWTQLQKRVKEREVRGTVFVLLGSSIIILSMFAAREMYHFFTPFSALLIMFISVFIVSLLGVIYKNKILYFVGFVLAVILPFLLHIQSLNYVHLFTYLFIISLGALWIDFVTKKSEMSVAAFVAYALYSIPHITKIISHSPSSLIIFAYLFTGLFLIIGTIYFIRKLEYFESSSVLLYGSSLLLLSWILKVGGDMSKISLLVWMFVFLGLGFLVYSFTHKNNLFLSYIGVAVAFLAAFTTLQYHGDVLIIAYIIEIFSLSLILFGLLGDLSGTRLISLLYVAPIYLSLGNITSHDWTNGIVHNSFFVLLLLFVTILSTGLFFSFEKETYSQDENELHTNKDYAKLFIILGSLYFYILLWLSLHAGLEKQTATIISLVIYVLIGLSIHFYGVFSESKNFEVYGRIMLIIVFIRLLIVDVWAMEFLSRIITFFVIGILLMATTFLKKKEDNILPDIF